MRLMLIAGLGALVVLAGTPRVIAQNTKEGAPEVITGGSSSTSIGGMPAARKGDATDGGGAVVEGSKNVTINGRPAVTTGDRSACGGIVVGGGSNVFINGKPVARAGDTTTGCTGQ